MANWPAIQLMHPYHYPATKFKKIKSLLQNPKSYERGAAVNCIPEYGVLFNFRSGQQTVRFAFCFKCGMFDVFKGEDDNADSINQNYMFTPMSGKLVSFAKIIFPNDEEIQSLR